MSVDKKTMPTSIKAIKILLFFKLSIIVLTVASFWFLKDIDSSTRSVLSGIKDGIIDHFDLAVDNKNTEYQFGRLLGNLLIPFLLIILLIFSIKEKRFIASIIFISIDIVFGLAKGLPILSIILLILILTTSSRIYLKQIAKNTNKQQDNN